MAQQIGIQAILDMGNFNSGVAAYTSGLSSLVGATRSVAGMLASDFAMLGRITAGVGGALAVGVGTAAYAALAAYTDFTMGSIQKSADLEQSIANVAAALGMAKDEVEPLRLLAMDLGIDPNLRVSAFEAADAMLMLAKNGITMQQQMDGAARSVITLSNATGGAFPLAADLLTDIIHIYGITGEEYARTTNILTALTNETKFNLHDVWMGLTNSMGLAAAVGVSFEDLAVGMGATASAFNTGRRSGTAWAQFMSRLPGTTGPALEMMEKYGIISGKSMEGVLELAPDVVREIEKLENQYDRVINEVMTLESTMTGSAAADIDKIARMAELTQEAERLEGALSPLHAQMNGVASATNRMGNRFYDQYGNFAGLANFSEVIHEALGDVNDQDRMLALRTMFGMYPIRVVTGLLEMTQEELAEWDRKILEGMDAEVAAATRMNTLEGTIKKITDQIDVMRVEIGDKFRDSMVDAGNSLVHLIDAARPYLSGAWDPVAESFANIASEIVPLVTDHLPQFIGVLEGFNNVIAVTLDRVWDFAKEALPELLTATANTFGWFEQLVETGNVFNEAFSTLPATTQNIIAAFAGTGAAIQTVSGYAQTFFGEIRQAAAPLENWIQQNVTLTDVFTALAASVAWAAMPLAIMGGRLLFVGTLAASVVSLLRQNFNEEMATIFTRAKDIITDFTTTAVGVFSDIQQGEWASAWERMEGFASRTWESIHQTAQEVFTAISGFISEIDWSQVGTELGESIAAVAAAIGDLLSGINWEGIGTGIRDFVTGFWDGLGDVFTSENWQGIIGGVSQFMWGLFSTVRDSVFSFISEGIQTVIPGLIEAVSTMLLNADWEGAWEWISGTVSDAIGRVIDTITETIAGVDWEGLWNQVPEGFRTSMEEVYSTVTEIWGQVQEFITATDWEALWGGIEAGAQTITDTFSTVETFVRELPGIFTETSTAIQTAWQGITDKFVQTAAEWEPVIQMAVGAFESISEAIQGLDIDWAGIASSIDGAISTVITAIGGLSGAVVDAIGEIANALMGEASQQWLIYTGVALLAMSALITGITGVAGVVALVGATIGAAWAAAMAGLAAVTLAGWLAIAGAVAIGVALFADSIGELIDGPMVQFAEYLDNNFTLLASYLAEELASLSNFISTFATFWQIASDIVITSIAAIVDAFSMLGEAMGFSQEFTDATTNLFTAIGEASNNASMSIYGTMAALIGVNEILSNPFSGEAWAQGMMNITKGMMESSSMGPIVRLLAQMYPETYGNIFDLGSMTDIMGDFMGIERTVDELVETTSGLPPQFVESTTEMRRLADTIRSLRGTEGETALDRLNEASEAMDESLGVLRQGVSLTGESVSQTFADEIPQAVREGGFDINGALLDWLGLFSNIGEQVPQGLADGITADMSTVNEATQELLTIPPEMMELAALNTGELANSAVDGFVTGITDAIAGMGGIEGGEGGIGAMLAEAFKLPDDQLEVFGEGFRQLVVDALTKFQEGFVEQQEVMLDSINTFAASIQEALGEQVTGAIEGITEAFTAMTTEITAQLSTLSAEITAIMGEMTAQVVQAITEMTTQATAAIQQFAAAIQSAMQEAVAAVIASFAEMTAAAAAAINEIIGLASAMQGAAYSAFFALGAAMGDGLIAGIRSKIAEAKAAVAELVSIAAAAGSVAADAHSPAGITIPLGRDIADGVIVGVLDRFNAFQSVMGDFVRSVNGVSAFEPVPIAAPPMASRSVSNNFGPFNVNSGMDEAELEYRIRRVVREEYGG